MGVQLPSALYWATITEWEELEYICWLQMKSVSFACAAYGRQALNFGSWRPHPIPQGQEEEEESRVSPSALAPMLSTVSVVARLEALVLGHHPYVDAHLLFEFIRHDGRRPFMELRENRDQHHRRHSDHLCPHHHHLDPPHHSHLMTIIIILITSSSSMTSSSSSTWWFSFSSSSSSSSSSSYHHHHHHSHQCHPHQYINIPPNWPASAAAAPFGSCDSTGACGTARRTRRRRRRRFPVHPVSDFYPHGRQ